jgi:hypothetical protein
MKHRQYISLALTMAIAFAAAFAYLYRSPHAAQAQSTPKGEESRRPEYSGDRPAAPLAAAAPGAASPAQSLARPTPNAPQQDYSNGPELPVIFNITDRTIMVNDPEGAEPSYRRTEKEAILMNSADQRFAITAIETNLPTMESSEAQLVLPPKGQLHFGSEWGLKMLPGDQLTLRSPPFRDLIKIIP